MRCVSTLGQTKHFTRHAHRPPLSYDAESPGGSTYERPEKRIGLTCCPQWCDQQRPCQQDHFVQSPVCVRVCFELVLKEGTDTFFSCVSVRDDGRNWANRALSRQGDTPTWHTHGLSEWAQLRNFNVTHTHTHLHTSDKWLGVCIKRKTLEKEKPLIISSSHPWLYSFKYDCFQLRGEADAAQH